MLFIIFFVVVIFFMLIDLMTNAGPFDGDCDCVWADATLASDERMMSR